MIAQSSSSYTYITGFWPIVEAIKGGESIEKVYIRQGFKSDKVARLRNFLKDTSIPLQYLPKGKFKKKAGSLKEGLLAQVAPIPYYTVESILMQVFEQGGTPFFLILDKVSDVRNFGAIARSAEALGADGIIIPAKGSAMINNDALTASAGALHHIPVCRIKRFNPTLAYLKESGLQVLAALETGNTSISNVDLTLPTALVMGGEGKGIPPEHLKEIDQQVNIPLTGKINALNVSVAASIILYEMSKQRA